jgi:hypothetical protein
MISLHPTKTIRSPLSSFLTGMGHLMDFSKILTNHRTGKEQDSDALKDDWRTVGADLRQAIHLYERLEKGRRK